MTEIITAEPISRRKALALFGLATAALASASVVAAPEAESPSGKFRFLINTFRRGAGA